MINEKIVSIVEIILYEEIKKKKKRFKTGKEDLITCNYIM